MNSKEAFKVLLDGKLVIDSFGYIYSFNKNYISKQYLCDSRYMRIEEFLSHNLEFDIYEETLINKEYLITNLVVLQNWDKSGSIKDATIELLIKYINDDDITKEAKNVIKVANNGDYYRGE